MNITLRHAGKEDAELIADISRQTFYETFAADNTAEDMAKFMNEQFTKGRLMLEVGAPENTFLLAEENSRAAGYVKLRQGKKMKELESLSTMEIARIYVLKDFIGRGVGKLLMQAAINIASQQQKEVIWLGVWEKNQRAINFYLSWGFEVFSECNFLLGNDLQRDLLMKKSIG